MICLCPLGVGRAQGCVPCWDLCWTGCPCRSSFTLTSVVNSSGVLRRAVGPEQGPKHSQACLAEVFIKMTVAGSAPGGF